MNQTWIAATSVGVLLWSGAACAGKGSPPADGADPESGVVERLGETVPLDLRFVDENGDSVRLGDMIDRPTLVSLVYYQCPSVCKPLLEEVSVMLGKLQKLEMVPGNEYRVLTISFDDTDSPDSSARLKSQYYSGELKDGFPASAWTFLTGDSSTVAAFTNAVGFHAKRVAASEYAHPTTLIVLSPQGKITRYLVGARYLPVDIKLALIEARSGRVGPTIVKFFQFCFSYDPTGRKYVLDATRIVGASTLIGLAGFVFFISASGRRRKHKAG